MHHKAQMDSFLNKFFWLLVLLLATPLALAQTKVGFYSSSCPKAESIVQATVKKDPLDLSFYQIQLQGSQFIQDLMPTLGNFSHLTAL